MYHIFRGREKNYMSRRARAGEGNGTPLQYSCLKNSMDCLLRSLIGDTHSLGWTHSCGQHAWHGCCCLLVCSPAVPPECPGSLSSHRAHFSRELPLGLRKTLGASHITCIVLCPLTILTQRIGPPLPSIPPAVTSGVVQDSCPFFASTQLLPLDP